MKRRKTAPIVSDFGHRMKVVHVSKHSRQTVRRLAAVQKSARGEPLQTSAETSNEAAPISTKKIEKTRDGWLQQGHCVWKAELAGRPNRVSPIIASAYRYDGDDSMSLPDLGLVRAAAVRLWIVLRETGTDVQVVSDLIASAKSDPLPEVRYFSVDESEEAD